MLEWVMIITVAKCGFFFCPSETKEIRAPNQVFCEMMLPRVQSEPNVRKAFCVERKRA